MSCAQWLGYAVLYDNLCGQDKIDFNRFKEKTITFDELHANGGGWHSVPGDYLDINKIKKKLRCSVLMRATESDTACESLDPLHGASQRLYRGRLETTV